jgi:hypothetical protein
MALSVALGARWLSALLGALAFCVVQIPLLIATAPVPGTTESGGWFLNSGRNVLLIGVTLAIGAAVLTARKQGSDRDAVFYGIGAVLAMIVTLFAIGAGNIFPIVIVFGSGLVVFAVGAGGTCGAAVRARRTPAAERDRTHA